MSRRDFNRLSMAAFGGLVSGAMIGCGQGEPEVSPEITGSPEPESELGEPGSGQATPEDGAASLPEEVLAGPWGETHVCRGLNACQGLGATGENACAGQGACATVAHHACAEMNDCKYQGGCGDNPGQNECAGMGSCQVPLMESVWEDARAAFESAMQEAGIEVSAAPEDGAEG